MKVLINRGLVYVPAWNGNKKLPKEEQVSVQYRYMTGPEREKIFDVDLEFNEDGKPKGGYKVKMEREKIIRTCVEKIVNMTVDDGGKDREGTVDDLFNLSELSGLYRELSDFFLSENEAPDKKK